MKTMILTFFAVGFCLMNAFGQNSDMNTQAISQYFEGAYFESLDSRTATNLVATKSRSEVNIVQVGIENNTYINSVQTGDSQMVSQSGEYNNYEYYNYYSIENSNLEVNQEGTLNSIQVFGENSLMKDAIINQKSDFNSIVIKNYSN